jgi:hypothetical protein
LGHVKEAQGEQFLEIRMAGIGGCIGYFDDNLVQPRQTHDGGCFEISD